MPIPLADRMGRLNAPNAQAGKAPDTASYEANIGKIGENTMKMLARSGGEMARAVTYMQRQQESMAAQDALTEYLAGRQKLDTVRDSLALENAVDFEDKYYQEAEKMHTEFVNKINRLKYADIRERARGQANDTNITDAARSENFFFKQKEAVADNHTAALVEVKKRDVVNSLSSNPGMDGYNEQNIANGYIFTIDTLKNRLIEKGYRDGTPEMDMAMSKAKDDYFASVLEELSHRPDDGLRMAHDMGKVFKQEMSPAAYNQVMRPISMHNLAQEVRKDPTRFFAGGDIINGRINKKAAARYSDALDDEEREKFLEAIQEEARKGKTAADAAQKVLDSKEYMQRNVAEWLQSNLGIWGNVLASTPDLDKMSPEDTKEMQKYLQQNANPTDIDNKLAEWSDMIPFLETEDQNRIRALESKLTNLLFDDPNISARGVQGTFFEDKNPTVADVGYYSFLSMARDAERKKGWRDWAGGVLNPFGIFGKSPIENKNLTNVRLGLRAVRDVASSTKWANKNFDDLKETQKREFFADLSAEIDRQTSAAYANRLGNTADVMLASSDPVHRLVDDFRGRSENRFSVLGPVGQVANTIMAYEIAAAYYGHQKVRSELNQYGMPEIPSMSNLVRDEQGNIIPQTSSPYKKKELKKFYPDIYSFYKNPIKRQ